jgi:hypothetical protein
MTYMLVLTRSIFEPLPHISEPRYDLHYVTLNANLTVGTTTPMNLWFVRYFHFFKIALAADDTLVAIGLS